MDVHGCEACVFVRGVCGGKVAVVDCVAIGRARGASDGRHRDVVLARYVEKIQLRRVSMRFLYLERKNQPL